MRYIYVGLQYYKTHFYKCYINTETYYPYVVIYHMIEFREMDDRVSYKDLNRKIILILYFKLSIKSSLSLFI